MREKKRFRILTIFMCIFFFSIILCIPYSLHSAETIQKQFTYYIFWTGIRAGKAVLTYTSTPDGVVIHTHATSTSFISLFYKVDDTAQSTMYPDGYPKEYVLKTREGFHRRHKITQFEKQSEIGSQKIIFNNVLDDDKEEYTLEKPAYDPLSAFYAMSQENITVGQSTFINIFDNNELFETEIQVIKKERKKVLAGEFDTILVKPLLKSEGIFRKTGEIKIWVTDDDRKIPVLLKSKALIGSFSVVLAEGDI